MIRTKIKTNSRTSNLKEMEWTITNKDSRAIRPCLRTAQATSPTWVVLLWTILTTRACLLRTAPIIRACLLSNRTSPSKTMDRWCRCQNLMSFWTWTKCISLNVKPSSSSKESRPIRALMRASKCSSGTSTLCWLVHSTIWWAQRMSTWLTSSTYTTFKERSKVSWVST